MLLWQEGKDEKWAETDKEFGNRLKSKKIKAYFPVTRIIAAKR